MKILLIEDSAASIKNARKQLAGHELVVATTVFEALEACNASCGWQTFRFQQFDIIVTDVNIPMGNAGKFDVAKHYKQTDRVAAGLVVAIATMMSRVPCFIITDSNSHRDIIGLLLDRLPLDDKKRRTINCITRPDTLAGGKDYGDVVKWLEANHKKKQNPA